MATLMTPERSQSTPAMAPRISGVARNTVCTSNAITLTGWSADRSTPSQQREHER